MPPDKDVMPPDLQIFQFPSVEHANPEGLLASGGDLSPPRLLSAYAQGIFPWFNDDQPILWWSPDPRAVFFPDRVQLKSSLRKIIRKADFEVRFDSAFAEVIDGCADVSLRKNESGTWITRDMRAAYIELHQIGYAHSIETWREGRLIGGLYGLSLGRAFFGESMFSREPNGSKIAFAHLVAQLRRWHFDFIDAQLGSPHIMSLGAIELPRAKFIDQLGRALTHKTRMGPWQLDNDLDILGTEGTS